MFFPILDAQVSDAEFQHSDLTWKESCGQMAHLEAESGGNKEELSYLVEAILCITDEGCNTITMHPSS